MLIVGSFKIWDTAGQERFRSMTAAFYGKAQGVVITFDVSQRSTFEALQSWINDVRDVRRFKIVLIIELIIISRSPLSHVK